MGNGTSGTAISAGLRTQLKEEIRALLISRARVRGMISYTDLAGSVVTVQMGPRDRLLYEILDEISVDEHSAGRGMLSCIVVHKAGDMEPGVGFYELAEHLGKKRRGKLSFWIKEMHEVHAVWEQPNNRAVLADYSPTQEANIPAAAVRSVLRPSSSVPARTSRRAASASRPRRVSG